MRFFPLFPVCLRFVGWCLLLALTACSAGPGSGVLTYKLVQRPFTVTVAAEGTLDAKMAQMLITPRLPQFRQLKITYLAPEGTRVKKGDAVVQFDPQDFENDYLSAQNDLELAQAELSRLQADHKAQQLTMESQMESAQASVAISRLQVAKLAFVAPRLQQIKRLEMQRDSLNAEKIRKQLASNKAIQKEEQANQAILIEQAKRKLKTAQESLDKLVLKAPTDGIVVYEASPWRGTKPQEGDALYPSEPVAKIPDLSVMQVVLRVGEIAAQKLKKGQRAEIDISSLRNAVISGKVTQVAKRAQPIKRGSKVKQVEVVVELDSTRADFSPGLSARVRIFVGEKPEALEAPLECVFEKDSSNVVYVRQGRRFVAKPVKIVEQNANFAILEGDVAVGAELALQAPESGIKNRE